MFKIAIETQVLQTEVPCPLKPSEHYFHIKSKFALFKPAVDPRGFKTEIQICAGPGWQYGRQQQPSPQSSLQAPTAAGWAGNPELMLRATARVLLSPAAHKDTRCPAAQPCGAARPQNLPHTQPRIPLPHEPRNPRRLFLNSLTATYFVMPNTCCIRKLLLLQALK